MNPIIERLNLWAEPAVRFAWPMLWQSSLLIAAVFVLDFILRRKVRAQVRYALWCVVLIKLLLPPSLALPTGIAWWIREPLPAPAIVQPEPATVIVTDMRAVDSALPFHQPAAPVVASLPAARAPMSRTAWGLVLWGAISFGLLLWLAARWRQVARGAGRAIPAFEASSEIVSLAQMFQAARRAAGVRHGVQLRLVDRAMSPAVFGLFRPVVLLPRALVRQLAPAQLRAVLLHELIHLRRRDVWVNCAQALLQIVYWWHPLLWFANARIRRLREEAVDDAVMVALADEADAYAPTLLEVAKLAFRRPLTALGLVGILESRRGLRQRIERLMNFRTPGRTGLSIASVLGIMALSAVALPMGKATLTAESVRVVPSGEPRLAGEALKRIEPAPPTDPVASNARTLPASAGWIDPGSEPAEIVQTASLEGAAPIQAANLIAMADATAFSAPVPANASASRITVMKQLDEVRIERVAYDRVPLKEVLLNLREQIHKHDPIRPRVNFLLKSLLQPDAAPEPPPELSALPITIHPAMIRARVTDVLDAILKGADKPIEYSVMDNSVIFRPKEPVPAPDALRQNDPAPYEPGKLLAASPAPAAPAEAAVPGTPKISQTQLLIKVQFVETPWPYNPPYDSPGGPDSIGLTSLGVEFAEANPFTILTAPQFDSVSRSDQYGKVAAAPRIIASSGHRTVFHIGQTLPVVTGINPQAATPPGVASTDGRMLHQITPMDFGRKLEIVATVGADGWSIDLDAMVTLNALLGYMEPANSTTVYVKDKKKSLILPVPDIHQSQATAHATIWDGQTLTFSKLIEKESVRIKDGPPLLGDLPLVGRLFRSDYRAVQRKKVIVYITPTILDSTGKRLHAEDRITLPPQNAR